MMFDTTAVLNTVKELVIAIYSDANVAAVNAIIQTQQQLKDPDKIFVALGRGYPAQSNADWIRISTAALLTEGASIVEEEPHIDVVITHYVRHEPAKIEDLETAENTLNRRMDTLDCEIPYWRAGYAVDKGYLFNLNGWIDCHPVRPSTRPGSGPKMQNLRLGFHYFRIKLN